MRLLDVRTQKLKTFYNHDLPRYAILSHTWLSDDQEVTFAQIQQPEACVGMAGYAKVVFLCEQAAKEGFEYAWIDTCCIDKTSSAELSEAINSMFEWYQRSDVCYALLSDIDDEDFLESKWWTRAWTLQELLAPTLVKFFNKDGFLIGTKNELAPAIEDTTGIDSLVLLRPMHMFGYSVAQRMSWAGSRNATRTEDIAYSLLGVFQVNMPLLYGEGQQAFLRLQEIILQRDQDQSLFAWSFQPRFIQDAQDGSFFQHQGLLAWSPKLFKNCGKIVTLRQPVGLESEIRYFSGGHHLEMTVLWFNYPLGPVGILPCRYTDQPEHLIGILLKAREQNGDNFPAPSNMHATDFVRYDNGTFLVHVSDYPLDSLSGPQTVHIYKRIDRQFNNVTLFPNPTVRDYHGTLTIRNLSTYLFHSQFPPEGTSPTWRFSKPHAALSIDFKETEVQRCILAFYKKKAVSRRSNKLVILILEWNYIDNRDPERCVRGSCRAMEGGNVSAEDIPRKMTTWWEKYFHRESMTWEGPTSEFRTHTHKASNWKLKQNTVKTFHKLSYILVLEDTFHSI